MDQQEKLYRCLNCHQSEAEIPLLALRYAQQQSWICSQCLPILIHQPHQLAGKLADADKFPSTPSGGG